MLKQLSISLTKQSYLASNILVHQNCACQSPLQCTCAGDGDVTYLLGDMDLLSLEEEGADLIYTLEEWQKMAYHDPAGTIGMKPPEVGIIWHDVYCIRDLFGGDLNLAVWQIFIGPPNLNNAISPCNSIALMQHLA